jgi:hypothetical protein
MPNLIKIDTKEYPVSLREFRERFKNTSFPPQFNLEDFGYAVVFDVPQPARARLQRVKELAPEISALGKYQQVWEVVNLRDEMTMEDYQTSLDRLGKEDSAVIAEQEKIKSEALIQLKIREMAVAALQAEGKLTLDKKVTAGGMDVLVETGEFKEAL